MPVTGIDLVESNFNGLLLLVVTACLYY